MSVTVSRGEAGDRVRCDRIMRLLGVKLHDISIDRLLDVIVESVEARDRLLVVNANAHLINLARREPRLVDLFERADVAFCDGAGVQFALKLQTGRRPARHTPPQWILPLGKRLAARDATVFWLGGDADVVVQAAEAFTKATGMRSVGEHHGFFDLTAGSAESDAVADMINRVKPDLLLVNLGMPRQELWLHDNWNRLQVTVALTGGALVDHVAGRVRRPPIWIADLGLEWLVRLAIEPSRLWQRYLIGLPIFGTHVLLSLVRGRGTEHRANICEQ
ncbi:MAG: WecB/TagA/CpsF family glycosyltransferase [Acetobacteraceae bacterium]|nr:WecB/TagA/CpsF family glycosyltransferase [Acetobacteraceae bacterium]